jgi:hypothetical protein
MNGISSASFRCGIERTNPCVSINLNEDNVGKTIINHPFGHGKHTTYKMVMTGGWFMALFYPH